MEQDLSNIDMRDLHPLSQEVISRQATINIGTIGHVAHGKSTLVKALSGVKTPRFKAEMERNITIKLGYANAKIYECEKCVRPFCYRSYDSKKESKPLCEISGSKIERMELLRHVSFVDCPGHEKLMSTMLSGATIMDAVLLVIAANEPFPQPQTLEHLAAIEIMKVENVILVQNKVDLVQPDVVLNQYKKIREFLKGTPFENSPVVPISAQYNYGVDVLCEYIVKKIPVPQRDFWSPPRMIIVRTFDINKPGTGADDLKGGIVGGSILKGVLRVGQMIEIRPGLYSRDADGNISCQPIYSRVVSLYAESNDLEFAVPGGLIGVGTLLDPTLTGANKLVGQILGEAGTLPAVYSRIKVKFKLMKSVVGGEDIPGKNAVAGVSKDEKLLLTVGAMTSPATVSTVQNSTAVLKLSKPICTGEREQAAISRLVGGKWRLIGWGRILGGTTAQVTETNF